jgi:hypothetical protein
MFSAYEYVAGSYSDWKATSTYSKKITKYSKASSPTTAKTST